MSGQHVERGSEFWKDRKKRGLTRVQFVGFDGTAASDRIYGRISLVTNRSVYVVFDGRPERETVHPGTLRPTNVWPAKPS